MFHTPHRRGRACSGPGIVLSVLVIAFAWGGASSAPTAVVRAQAPVPTERITFADAIKRAIAKNPTSQIAAAGILRAEALLREARHSVGTAVAGGMIASTFLNLAFIPVLYVVVKSIGGRPRA